MSKNYSDIVISLAGMCQTASLVHNIANTGNGDNHYENVLIDSLGILSPASALDVYGNDLDNIKLGLTKISEILEAQRNNEIFNIIRYIKSMMQLESALMQSNTAQDMLRNKLMQFIQQSHFFQENPEQKFHSLAGIYSEVISPLGRKIEVKGSESILTNPFAVAKIRSLLLAGVRSAVLWEQVGGSRWQLIFSNSKLLKSTKHLLSYAKA